MSRTIKRRVGVSGLVAAAALTVLGGNVAMADTAAAAPPPEVSNAEWFDAACTVPPDRDLNVTTRIYQIATQRQVTPKVLLSAFEAGWVESHMHNLNCGDRDSLGVFQQRPSQGWCDNPADCLNVDHATNAYLDQAIPNDLKTPGFSAGQLAQSVQRSAYPERYDQAQAKAQQMIAEVRG
ncbi:hypothetical protein CFN78_25860 [Amycolatopsis antarctica]|uniref:Secreted protein n=1 Tax=Amycolatopsis antarctica TaxID=1854586 RepID=A0A263CWK0_9PSEU|nr:hypothetical protein [Amycolatopsis antarctica]OZM70349.1 hypothetical protein CFN78_25860 [Amycolatopsis antarctica]